MVNKGFSKIGDALYKFDIDRDKYISVEFQKYGYDLAVELGDLAHKTLYLRLAKTTPRRYLDEARNFVKGAYNVRNRAKLFMWKLKQLKAEKKDAKTTPENSKPV